MDRHRPDPNPGEEQTGAQRGRTTNPKGDSERGWVWVHIRSPRSPGTRSGSGAPFRCRADGNGRMPSAPRTAGSQDTLGSTCVGQGLPPLSPPVCPPPPSPQPPPLHSLPPQKCAGLFSWTSPLPGLTLLCWLIREPTCRVVVPDRAGGTEEWRKPRAHGAGGHILNRGSLLQGTGVWRGNHCFRAAPWLHNG